MHNLSNKSTNSSLHRIHHTFDFTASTTGQLSTVLAEFIAKLRLSGNSSHYQSWQNHRAGIIKNSSNLSTVISALLSDCVGTPTVNVPKNQLEGAISHYLWYGISIDYFKAHLISLEPPSFSPLDGGGDGIEFSQIGTTYFTRLWEIKKESSGKKISATTQKACNQINSRAISYLARYVASAELEPDQILKQLKQCCADDWMKKSPNIGVGISIASCNTNNDFKKMSFADSAFPSLPNSNQITTIFSGVHDFGNFCIDVRKELWKGI